MKFSVFQVSRKGGRKNNEDRMGYCYTSGAAIFLLADGMGGHPRGEVAAELTLQVIAGMFHEDAKPELPDVGAFLTAAVMAAHRQILRYAVEQKMADAPEGSSLDASTSVVVFPLPATAFTIASPCPFTIHEKMAA